MAVGSMSLQTNEFGEVIRVVKANEVISEDMLSTTGCFLSIDVPSGEYEMKSVVEIFVDSKVRNQLIDMLMSVL